MLNESHTHDDAPATLEQQLAAERRECGQCGYAVLNPLTDRCPRCFAHIARTELECGSCTHQGNCEFARAATHARR